MLRQLSQSTLAQALTCGSLALALVSTTIFAANAVPTTRQLIPAQQPNTPSKPIAAQPADIPTATTITNLTLSEVIVGCGNECAGIKAVWGVRTSAPKIQSFVVKVQEQAPCLATQCRAETITLSGDKRSAATKNLSPTLNGDVTGTFKVTVTANFTAGISTSTSKVQNFN
jgi:hypothetical protein